MKNSTHPKALPSVTVDSKRIRGGKHRELRDSVVENFNLTMPDARKDGRIDRWMKRSKSASNWEHMVKSMVLRDRPITRSNDEDDNDADEDDDEELRT